MVFGFSHYGEAAGRSRVLDLALLASALADTVSVSTGSDTTRLAGIPDTIRPDSVPDIRRQRQDSVRMAAGEGPAPIPLIASGTAIRDSVRSDTTGGDLLPIKNFLDEPITGTSKDSLRYNVKNKMVYIHKEGDVKYGSNMNLKADFIQVRMDSKELYAYGITDSLGNRTKPEFIEKGNTYTMDTILYNIETEKAKIKGVVTQEGEGLLLGDNVKKMPDNAIHIRDGKYTTCEDHEHPHFYISMTKGKVLPGDKVIVGPSYMVVEDVPIYFLGIPEGFFPLISGPQSGILVPSYGEENARGFYLRDGGYYFIINDYIDLTVRGSIYTKGSWELRTSSNYIKRYKYGGTFNFDYSKTILGEKGLADYQNYGSYKVGWSHRQDPKANPGSTFTASVNFQTTSYAKYGSETISDFQSATTQSRISYQKSWAGTPFSMSASFGLDQSRKDSTYTISFPNINFNMSRINPLKRKNPVGKERWYEKIAMTYSGSIQNSVKTKESDLFSEQMFRDMKHGVQHRIPINTSFNIFNHINVTPSINYNANWYFQKTDKVWDPVEQKQVFTETTYGFYRVYNYNVAASASTTLYGMWEVTNKYPKFPIRQVRHTLTPTIGFAWAPDFNNQKYGFYKPVQKDDLGNVEYYSPYSGQAFAVPTGGRQGNITFSLAQTLEAKVKDDSDSTGMRKVKFIDNLSFSGSYNLLADEFRLSKISANLRMTLPFLKDFQLNLTGVFDPYYVRNENGVAVRENELLIKRGGFMRLESTSWSFSYTFNGGKKAAPGAINDIAGYNPMYDDINPYMFDPNNPIDPEIRRQMMVRQYYDFSVPWSFSFNYNVSYNNNGVKKTVDQKLSFNGSVTLTGKWGITFSGFGFDFNTMKLTPGSFNLTRDLHCWQMSFNWVPLGSRKSWNFKIAVKSSMLSDLKYDKSSSYMDNIYGQSN